LCDSFVIGAYSEAIFLVSNMMVSQTMKFAVLRGAKSESTCTQVSLMKMKMKAEGKDSIPQVYYFSLSLWLIIVVAIYV